MRIASWVSRGLAASIIMGSSLALSGCPSGMCLVKVCKGDTSNCRCSWSTCPNGSEYSTSRNTCVCSQGRVALNGACLTLAEANEYCGKGSRYENYGCVRIQCPPGQELDLDTNQCLAKAQVDQVAQNMGVPVGQNQKLGCPPGLVLVMENAQSASCVPPQNACARDEVWNGNACVKTQKCQPGWIFDTQKNACVPVTTDDKEYTVQLGQWTLSTYGPDGGAGTSAFCSGFNKKPSTFGVGAGGSIRVVTQVQVAAPGKNVAQAQVQTQGIVEASRQPVTQKGAQEIQRSAHELLSSLARQGGKADAETARTTVVCTIVNAARPQAVPTVGGF